MSRAEKHWDYICLSVLTIATAALAGVFFILGIGDLETRLSGWMGTASVTMAGMATLLYSMMVVRTAKALFVPERYQILQRLERKRGETREAFALFGGMMAPLLAVVMVTLIIPVYAAHFTMEGQKAGEPETSGEIQAGADDPLKSLPDGEETPREPVEPRTTLPDPPILQECETTEDSPKPPEACSGN